MSLREKTISGAKWSAIATVIIIGLGLVQMTVLARIIDNHQFGLLTVSLVIIALADTLSDFGIANSIIQRKEISHLELTTLYWLNVGLGLVVCVAVFLLSDLIGDLLNNPDLAPLIKTLSLAFVVDEFGSVEGIVTLSDVTETIAGNLPNEVEEIDARHDIQKNADGSWTANGHMPLEDLVQYVPLPLDEKREYHTIAGLLMEYLQRIPKPGEEVQVGDYLLKTLQVESHRVQKVQIIPLHKDGEMEYEV